MKSLLHKKIGVGLTLLALFPLTSFTSELRLDASMVNVRAGEEFSVETVLFTDEPVNAVEGRIIFPEDMLVVKEISDGNSSINFWVERPRSELPGVVIFSGVTPGGFSGVNNLLFSVTFEAKKTGMATISISNAKALQNDGEGTEAALSLRNVAVEIKAGDSSTRKEEVKDTVQPEPFALSVARNPSVYDGEWFVAFATSDKDSGVSRYEVKEFRFSFLSFLSPWTHAESPYVLKDQNLKSYTVVKAIDYTENERISIVAPQKSLSWYDYLSVFGILVVALAFCVFIFKTIWRRK